MADQAEKVREILRRRADAYRTLVQTPGWGDCLQEMLAYADRATDAAVRCGRLDMIAHIIRAADTAGNILTEAANGTT
jgi:hypothetical protein